MSQDVSTHGDLTQFFPTFQNPVANFNFSWAAWLQILANSTLIYLSFDTHDNPGAISM